MKNIHFRAALTKALIVLLPSYLVAFLTDKMVYVVPTLAAASFFAASLTFGSREAGRSVDDDGEQDEGDIQDSGLIIPDGSLNS